jgi:hypothetical protein
MPVKALCVYNIPYTGGWGGGGGWVYLTAVAPLTLKKSSLNKK